jgi:hypothetical protein
VYMDVIIPHIRNGAGGASQFRIGALRVFSSLVQGSHQSKSIKKEHVTLITNLLSDKDLMSNENALILVEVARLLFHLVQENQEELFGKHDETSYSIFCILGYLMSSEGTDKTSGYLELQKLTFCTLNNLALQLQLENAQQVFAFYFDRIIQVIFNSMTSWTRYSPEKRLFDTLLLQSGPFVGSRLDILFQIFKCVANVNTEFEISFGLLNVLNKLMQDPSATLNSHNQLSMYSERILNDVLLNNLVWRAGRKAIVLRQAVADLFLKFVNPSHQPLQSEKVGLLEKPAIQALLEAKIIPNLVSILEEDLLDTRRTTLMILNSLFDNDILLEGTFLILFF